MSNPANTASASPALRDTEQDSNVINGSSIVIDNPARYVQRWTLNRPESYNSLDMDLIESLYEQIEMLKSHPEIRVIIIRGAGRGFSAGHDLAELIHVDSQEALELCFRQMTQIAIKMQRMRQAVITTIHGTAAAAGCMLVAASDLAIAAEAAKFSTPGINVGLFCFTPMVELNRTLPQKIAMEMLLTGDPITAQQAANFGFINRIEKQENLDAAAINLANKLANKPSYGLFDGKRAFYQMQARPIEESYEIAVTMMNQHFTNAETQQRVTTFLAKQKK